MKLKSNLRITKNDPILRMCVVVMTICIVLLGIIFTVTYKKSRHKNLVDSMELAHLNVSKANEIVGRHLTVIEVTAKNLASTRIRTYRDEAHIYDLLERFVIDAPEVWGIAIGYEPGVLPDKAEGFAPYVRHNADQLERLDLLAEGRDYLNAEWYRSTIDRNEESWSKPFRDVKGVLIACYCIPLLDEQNNRIGVIAVDMQLDRFTDDLIKEIHPYEHSECMVLDDDMDFIAHPDHNLILTPFVDYAKGLYGEKAIRDSDSFVAHIGKHESGYDVYGRKTDNCGLLFFSVVEQTNWTVLLSVPMTDVFSDSLSMARTMLCLCLLGILILVLACAFVFRNICKVVEVKSGIEKELTMAHSIQMSMVKKVFPPYPDRNDIDVFATLIPAKEVGGDLYDFAIHGDIFHFCIGDVSGKGVPASLFMATTRTLYRSIIAHEDSPAKIAMALNDAISSENDENMFVTMFIGALNLKSGVLTVCNCGHNSPLANDGNGRMSYMTQPPVNIPVGVVEEFEYREMEMDASRELRLFVYTDGVTEAENSAHKLYGDNKLEQVVNDIAADGAVCAQREIEGVLDSVKSHANGYAQSDDITMISVHYKRTAK